MNNPENCLSLLSLDDLQRIVPLSRTTIWGLERQGDFPRRIRIGPNRVAWVEIEVEAWINDRLAERGAER